MMNAFAQLEFDRITALEPKELNKDEIAFLRARRAYLRPEQKQVYAELFVDKKKYPEMTKEEKAVFNKENRKALAKKKRDEEAKKKATKTIKESQNPKGD